MPVMQFSTTILHLEHTALQHKLRDVTILNASSFKLQYFALLSDTDGLHLNFVNI